GTGPSSTSGIATAIASATRGPTCSSRAPGDERGRLPPAGADPARHDESAGKRDAGRRAPARLSRGERRRVRAVREGPRAGELDPVVATMLAPVLSVTLSPTMIHASRQRNVIPALCSVTVDCRLQPEQTQAEAEAAIREAIGDRDGYELEWIEAQGGTRSSIE